ncbi:hypothetical protein [Ornithinimicrobium kibberense]|uniref:hypothetical protein n=1 Tax=Ornithinimicrobium kibberense TaxID=282060 RepID=UPI00361A9DB5
MPVDDLLQPRRAVPEFPVAAVAGHSEVLGEGLDRAGVGHVVGGVHRLDALPVELGGQPLHVIEPERGEEDDAGRALEVAHGATVCRPSAIRVGPTAVIPVPPVHRRQRRSLVPRTGSPGDPVERVRVTGRPAAPRRPLR